MTTAAVRPVGKDYDVLLKIVLIGDSGIGKTSLLQRFAEQHFSDSHITTIGVDFKLRTIQVGSKKVKLQVWDTAGQEKFRVITKAYYRNAAGIIIGYDVTNGESFVSTRRWMSEVKNNCGDDGVPIILIGNKCDAPNRVVSLQDQQTYSQMINVPFFETSAKDNINVDEIFIELTRLVLERQARLSQTQPVAAKTTNNGFHIDSKSGGSGGKPKKNCC